MILSMLIAFADSGDKGIYLCYGVIIAGIFQMLLLAWANYKNGFLNGNWLMYYPNGRVAETGNYILNETK